MSTPLKYIVFDFPKTLFDINAAQEPAWAEVQCEFPLFQGHALEHLIEAEGDSVLHAKKCARKRSVEAGGIPKIPLVQEKWQEVFERRSIGIQLDCYGARKLETVYSRVFADKCRLVKGAMGALDVVKALGLGLAIYGQDNEHMDIARSLGVTQRADVNHFPLHPMGSSTPRFSSLRRRLARVAAHGQQILFIGAEDSPEMGVADNWDWQLLAWGVDEENTDDNARDMEHLMNVVLDRHFGS